jgi:HSF-type DNA-binding
VIHIFACEPCANVRADNGTTFVVKDTETFRASFKVKWESFVRQLHFYGFKKILPGLQVKDSEATEESKYWKYHHEKFRQGRPELLLEMKKPNHHTETVKREDFDDLKSQVTSLKKQLVDMGMVMQQMASFLSKLEQHPALQDEQKPPKRVYSPLTLPPSPTPSAFTFNSNDFQPISVTSGGDQLPNDLMLGPVAPSTPRPWNAPEPLGRSAPSLSHSEELMVASLLADSDPMSYSAPPQPVLSMPAETGASETDVPPYLMDRLREALSKLPPEMQTLLVERVVSNISEPDEYHRQMEALGSLASAAASEAMMHFPVSNSDRVNPNAVQLATATLGAYLRSYLLDHSSSNALMEDNLSRDRVDEH